MSALTLVKMLGKVSALTLVMVLMKVSVLTLMNVLGKMSALTQVREQVLSCQMPENQEPGKPEQGSSLDHSL